MSYVWLFANFLPPQPTAADLVWIFLPIAVIWALMVLVYCISRGDETETDALPDPIDETKE